MMFLIIFRKYSEDLNSLYMATKNFKLSTHFAEIPVEAQNQHHIVQKKKISSITKLHKNWRSLTLLKYNLLLHLLS